METTVGEEREEKRRVRGGGMVRMWRLGVDKGSQREGRRRGETEEVKRRQGKS